MLGTNSADTNAVTRRSTSQVCYCVKIKFMSSHPQSAPRIHIAISATFTVEPIEKPLSFWLATLGLSHTINFSPFNQVFQQLLDTNSLFAHNDRAPEDHPLNLIYLRLQDWLTAPDINALLQSVPSDNPVNAASVGANGQMGGSQTSVCAVAKPGSVDIETYLNDSPESASSIKEALERNARDLVNAVKVAGLRTQTPCILCFCPSSPEVLAQTELAHLLTQVEALISAELASETNVQVIDQQRLLEHYPVTAYYDAQADKLGHLPYTSAFFASLAAMTMRRYHAMTRRPSKVIVLDCDNTLWEGVCGEDGATGVHIGPAHKALQAFMVEQKNAGMLICLCSKNIEQDVFNVFDQHPDMVLKRADIVSWRINWEAKSDNLMALCEELQLGLDSFVFIDDNPVECAEVQARCPEAITLQIPTDSAAIMPFLKNIWALDKLSITNEDLQRANHYKENVKRKRLRSSAATLKDFLQNLDLEISISEPAAQHFPRLAQLTQRTNQFNTTTIRQTESDLSRSIQNGRLKALAVHVKDRFGDYGLVGLALYAQTPDTLQVESFMLSCRALGRGVEHAAFKHLASIANSAGCSVIEVAFAPSAKNKPAKAFLDQLVPAVKTDHPNGQVYQYKTAQLLQLDPLESAVPSAAQASSNKNQETVTPTAGLTNNNQSLSISWQDIATDLSRPARVVAYIQAQSIPRPDLQIPYVQPITALEKSVAGIWQDVMHIEKIGLDDGFKELGGSSLQLVQIHSRLHELLQQDIPLTRLFGLPTIRDFIRHIDKKETVDADAAGEANAIQQRAAKQKAAMEKRKALQKLGLQQRR